MNLIVTHIHSLSQVAETQLSILIGGVWFLAIGVFLHLFTRKSNGR